MIAYSPTESLKKTKLLIEEGFCEHICCLVLEGHELQQVLVNKMALAVYTTFIIADNS